MRYGVMHHVKVVKNGALYKNKSEENGWREIRSNERWQKINMLQCHIFDKAQNELKRQKINFLYNHCQTSLSFLSKDKRSSDKWTQHSHSTMIGSWGQQYFVASKPYMVWFLMKQKLVGFNLEERLFCLQVPSIWILSSRRDLCQHGSS